MSATKKFKNVSTVPYSFKIYTNAGVEPYKYDVAPGEVCDVPTGYAGNFMARRAPGLKEWSKLTDAEKSDDWGSAPEPKAPEAPAPESAADEPKGEFKGFGKGKKG